ncbi:TIGR01841 family phasin [Massilia sp. DWR3-1-1]|uniref:phasin family protein n=1 Tax=Massilia sp. DWR3-1-1 TaxID=2804559 RepID=UPI003CF4C3E9
MNLLPDQMSAAGARQIDAQLQMLHSVAGSALDGIEQWTALQFTTTRDALEQSTQLLRELAAARDPRDLFALTKQARTQFDNLLTYQSRLFGIATAMSGTVVGLPRAVTPAASAALQKLASLPPVAATTPVQLAIEVDHIIEQTNDVVEAFADEAAQVAAPAAAPAPAPAADDIIEQTNDVVETLAAEQAPAIEEATPPVNAEAAAAPFTVASTATPIEVESLAPAATPPVSVAKPAGRQRKK